ncbi:hypothetical protein EI555_004326, partial [Monodon monoceros]
ELTLTCKGIRHVFVKTAGVWLGKQDSSPRTWSGLYTEWSLGLHHKLPTLACLWPLGEEFEASSITSVFSNRAVVKYSCLEDVLHGCSWKVNNELDGTYLPLPMDKVIQQTKKMTSKIAQYSLIDGNCKCFVNDLRYGVPRSQQVWHPLPPPGSDPGSWGLLLHQGSNW